MRILHRKVGKYQGAVIFGTEVAPPPQGPNADLHSERAYWLTGEVETGNKLGSVMMADGTGFTIGLDQHIAVYPRELAAEDFDAEDDQGGAWKLLAKMEGTKSEHIKPLWDAFAAEHWYIATDGGLRWLNDGQGMVGIGRNARIIQHKAGDLVHGSIIREAITPRQGVVQKGTPSWETCRRWATLLHNLTADTKTAAIQKEFGLAHLHHRVKHRKLQPFEWRLRQTMEELIYGCHNISTVKSSVFSPQFDLALCVFHSYTVNAPSLAFRILKRVVRVVGWKGQSWGTNNEIVFARILLGEFKWEKYGRWDARWNRTRQHAMRVGWWPKELFRRHSLMPLR